MEQQAWKKELDQQAKAKAQAKGKAKPKAKAKAKSQSKAKAKKEKGPKEAKAKARGRPRKNGTKVEKTPEKSQEAGMSASPKAKVEKKAKAEKNVKGKETKPKETAVNKRKHDGDKDNLCRQVQIQHQNYRDDLGVFAKQVRVQLEVKAALSVQAWG